jgi:hypothetical protein
MAPGEAVAADAAVASARAALGLDAREPVRTWRVARMHPGERDFLLVIFGEAERATAIAAVDAISGQVLESARLPGTQPHSLLTAEEAIRRAGLGAETQAQLVWDPSPATRSRFYPLWQLQTAEGPVWVDSVRGTVWQTLAASKQGGS